LSGAELVIALSAVIVGAAVQGSIGFGLNLVVVPVVAVLNPEAVPGPLILLTVPLTAAMAVREHHAVDLAGFSWITLGRLPGTLLGVGLVAWLSADALSILVGVFVVVAVAMSSLSLRLPVRRETAAVAGVASGAMGTAAAIGGPPVALLYQHHHGPVLRSTLAAVFTVGTPLSIVGLVAAGELHLWHAMLALALAPGLLVGLGIARLASPWLDRGWLRPAVLLFAAVAGLAAVANGLW
jgi:uncharacterized membrane protein YfcA